MSKFELINMKVGDVFAGITQRSWEQRHKDFYLRRRIISFDAIANNVTHECLDGPRKSQKSTIKMSSFASWAKNKLTEKEVIAKGFDVVNVTYEKTTPDVGKSTLFTMCVTDKSKYPDIITRSQVKPGDVVSTRKGTYLVFNNLTRTNCNDGVSAIDLKTFDSVNTLPDPLLRVVATVAVQN